MNNDLIIKVNKFVELEYHKQAINLLQKNLEINPSDLSALVLLVRIYRLLGHSHQLNNQFKQAIECFEYSVKYLKESVKQLKFITDFKKFRKDSQLTDNFYDVDDFTEDDYKYIDEKSNDVDEIYLHDSEEHNSSILEPDTVSDDYIDLIFDDSKVGLEVICIANDLNNEETEKIGEYDTDDDINIVSDYPTDNLEKIYIDNESTNEEIEINYFDVENIESDEILEFYKEDNENIFSWDDLEDFEESKNDIKKHEIIKNGFLSNEERANQIAIDILHKYGWDKKYLPLLRETFEINCWAASRVAIERQLNLGMLPEELKLALFIRELWASNGLYWVSFFCVYGGKTQKQHEHIGWIEPLRIIRSFNFLPSEEEIQFFIEQTHDDWYSSKKLCDEFKTFILYLIYSAEMKNRIYDEYNLSASNIENNQYFSCNIDLPSCWLW